MGWLEGLLTGYADRNSEIRQSNAAAAEAASGREAAIYKALLDSPDPKIKATAAVGLLQTAQPNKLKGGFGGWLGQMEQHPAYEPLMKYMSTPQQVGEDVKTTTTTPEQAGYLPTLPSNKPAAQSPTQTTTPGAPGPATPLPMPQAGPPPAPPAGLVGPAAGPAADAPAVPPEMLGSLPGPTSAVPGGGVSAAPPTPPPSIAQLGPDQLRGQLAPETKPAPLVQTTRTPIMGLPHAFPTSEDTEIAQARAKGLGEFQYLTEVARRSGQPNPEKWAADQIAANLSRSQGTPYRLEQVEWTGEDGQKQAGWGSYNQRTGGFNLGDGTALPPNAHIAAKPGTTPTRALTKYEEVAARLFGTGDAAEDPIQVARHLTPLQRGQVEQEVAVRDAEAALKRTNTLADANLAKPAKAHLEEQLAGKWQTVQKPLVEMRNGVQDMQAALNRFNADPNGASQAIVTTFEKILNPTSMVRQQAYERTPSYLGLDQKVQGLWERYAGRVNPDTGQWVSGGPGIPLAELQELAETARQFLVVQASNNDGERARIEAQIRDNQLNPQAVFGNTVVAPPKYGTDPAAGGAGGAGGGATTGAPGLPGTATRGKNEKGQTTIIIQ